MELTAALVPDATIRTLWEEFATDLITRRRQDLKLRSRIEHAVGFFVALALAFPGGKGLDAESYLRCIDSRLMRRHLLASRYVATRLGVADQSVRQATSEARKIEEVVAGLPRDMVGNVLHDYAHHLTTSPLAPRTRRLYLHAAYAFADGAPLGRMGWKPSHLLSHLRRSPGQAASLGRFVTYCRKTLGWDVRMPPKGEFAMSSTQRVARSVAALRSALAATDGLPLDLLSDGQLVAILSPALGLSAAAVRRLKPSKPTSSDLPIRLADDLVIDSGNDLHPFARRWALLRQ